MTTLTGIMPVVPTAFADDESLDLASQRRVTDFLIDAEVDGICVMANYSEQFSVSDAERTAVIDTTLEHVAGRVPVCVTTSHYSARIANERNRAAEERGAAMVMMMPPFFGAAMSVDEAALEAYFVAALDGVSIPLMLQDAPLSTTRMSAGTIAALARALPTLRYAKIEMPQTAAKLRAVAATAGDDLPGLFDGEEAVTLIPDLEAGAVGTMTSALLPEHAGRAARAFLAGDREGATAIWEDVLPLIQYENRQCGLRASKEVLYAGGVLASAHTRSPFGPDRRAHAARAARAGAPQGSAGAALGRFLRVGSGRHRPRRPELVLLRWSTCPPRPSIGVRDRGPASPARAAPVASALADGGARILRGNGALTVASRPGLAAARLYLLEATAAINLEAAAAGTPQPIPGDELEAWREVAPELLGRLWAYLAWGRRPTSVG